MADEQTDIGTDASGFYRRALRREIDRTAAVGVGEDSGNPLRDERLALAQGRVPQALRRVG